MERKKPNQASRFLNPPPEKLGQIIEIVNLIPPDYDLPDLSKEMTAPFVEAMKREDIESAKRVFNDEIQKRLKDVPEAFVNWLNTITRSGFVGVDYVLTDYSPTEGYRNVKQWRENLRIIARYAKQLQELKSQAAQDSPESLKGDWTMYLPLQAPSACLIDNDGKLQTWSDGFIEAIKGVEAWRIRECARCNRIFWAGRSDMWSCSTACAHAIRSKRWRENYQSKYKLQRNGQPPLSSEEKKRIEEKKTLVVRRTTKSGAKKGK